MNMKTALFVAILSIATSALARPYESEEYTDNNLIDLPYGDTQEEEHVDYLEITSPPKKDIHYPAEAIEAECRVSGMPVPTVEWVLGSGSFDNNDFETNSIMETSPSGIATVVARLIVKPHHIKPGTTKTFTCVGRSGGKVVKASTTVHFSNDAKHHSMGNNLLTALVGGQKTRIYEFFENLFENIGSNVMLPCRATEKAKIYWINDAGKQITGQESRFKILPSGELMITNLQFKDMGTYICVAKNSVSRDVASTFLYPLAANK